MLAFLWSNFGLRKLYLPRSEVRFVAKKIFDNCFVTKALFLEMIILNLFLSRLLKKKQTMKFLRVGELYLDLHVY